MSFLENTVSSMNVSQINLNRLYGLQALARSWRNPSDPINITTAIHGLRGPSGQHMCQRLRDQPAGRRILAGQDPILEVLNDRESLRRLPNDSLGYVYLSFVEHYGFTVDGIEVPKDTKIVESLEVERVARHLRYVHDLWHVVFGYRPDLPGDLSLGLVAYTQTKNPGTAIVVSGGILKLIRTHPGIISKLKEAYIRGKNSEWLPGVDWHDLLARPLKEVRQILCVAPQKEDTGLFD